MNKNNFDKVFLFIIALIFVGNTAFAQKNPVKKILLKFENQNQVLVTAHRAKTASNKYPECSLSTVKECIKKGVDIVELDIRETADGALVIMHDKEIDRTTNGTGLVIDYTLAELRKFRLMHEGKVTQEKIPTLDEVLTLIKGKIMLDVDFKASTTQAMEATYKLIEKYGVESQILFFLYDYTEIPFAYSLNKNVRIMPRAYSLEHVEKILEHHHIKIIHIDESVYHEQKMSSLLESGIRVWINALGKYDSQEVLSGGGFEALFTKNKAVNVIQTDIPESLISYLKTSRE